MWEPTAISIYLASSLLSVSSAATRQNESRYYNMLLDDDSSAELKSNREAQNISFNVGNYFSSKNTIKDILECKEFSGFANLLVPETDKKDLNVHLNEFQRIMLYHRGHVRSHVHARLHRCRRRIPRRGMRGHFHALATLFFLDFCT